MTNNDNYTLEELFDIRYFSSGFLGKINQSIEVNTMSAPTEKSIDLETFKQRVLEIDFSQSHPNVDCNWQFEETEKAFIANCGTTRELLRGKGYRMILWKPDERFPEDNGCLQLVSLPQTGMGTILEKYLM